MDDEDDMGRKRFKGQVIGIRLVSDCYTAYSSNHQLEDGKVIGAIYISSHNKTCKFLRHSIKMYLDVPKDFCFLTSKGWPLHTNLEDQIQITDCILSGIVTIQTKHEYSRIGIKLLGGDILGFIFLKFSSDLSYIRNRIMAVLGDKFYSNETFEFIENNSWPVQESQEKSLFAWDVVVNNCITIVKQKIKRNSENEDYDQPHKKSKYTEKPLMDLNKEELNSYDILISYVHAEASVYARSLKTELQNMGFQKIFLDTDNIPAGKDWQDVISFALSNCSVFVPLVTPRYGGTRWTNREAKLADDKEKFIIPVSFLDKWPPDQLAIQFVSLQYIPWKTDDEINEGLFARSVGSVWSEKSVKRVAEEIKNLYEQDVSMPDSISLLDNGPRISNFSLKLGVKQKKRKNYKYKDFIIISAHSKQKNFVTEVTKLLENLKYRVWCSMSMCECDENAFSPIEDSQPMINSPVVESVAQSLHSQPFHENKSTFDHASDNVKKLKREFKDKVKLAKLVILIFSEDYLKSRICWQQLYYCEQRKKAIVIKFGDFHIDSIVLNFYPEHEMIPSENFESLKFKISEKLKYDSEDSYRDNILLLVSKLKNDVDVDSAVYVIGGTNSISTYAEQFCISLGTELAKMKNLILATEGFLGAGDLVGKNFCEEQEILDKGKSNVFHIVPNQDNADFSKRARQLADGKFEKLPYGRTLFYGNSVSQRDHIVAAAFKLCILIEGGERSACLAEKFLWNDCTVIPVLYNNNTITNKQQLSESITKAPCSVDENDWENLNRQNCSPDERVASVKNIVCTLLNLNT